MKRYSFVEGASVVELEIELLTRSIARGNEALAVCAQTAARGTQITRDKAVNGGG